jgi:hypothetical protein
MRITENVMSISSIYGSRSVSAHASHSRAALLCLLLVLSSAINVPASTGAVELDFLVPGISLRSVSFETGTAVSYLIISESYGVADTSFVELAVLEADGETVLLEVSTSPFPRTPDETIWIRLRLEEGVRHIESSDEFMSFVKEVLVREGVAGGFERPAAEDIEELELERMFLPSRADTARVPLGPEEVETPAGPFRCDKFGIVDEQTIQVNLGGIEAVRYEREETFIWLSPRVPFWGLVRSRIERESSTSLPGRPRFQPKPRSTATESVLVSYKGAASR